MRWSEWPTKARVWVLLIDKGTRVDLGEAIESLLNADRTRSKVNVSASGAYMTVGTGSQILRDLGVHKMRLLSSPMKIQRDLRF